MRNVRNIEWQRALTEGAVIVFSILLAFWIDAWWGQRVEDERVDSLLRALEKEWAEDLDRIEEAIPRWEQYVAFTAGRINASLQDVESFSDEELGQIFDNAFLMSEDALLTWPYYNPSMGAWNAAVLVALPEIDDVELSSAIAGWPSQLERLTILGEAVYSVTDTESGRAYSEFNQSRKVRINPETGYGEYDSDEQRLESLRALLQDENRLVWWRQAARAAGAYRGELELVRIALHRNLELLRSKLDD
jgi:hypothetical protein